MSLSRTAIRTAARAPARPIIAASSICAFSKIHAPSTSQLPRLSLAKQNFSPIAVRLKSTDAKPWTGSEITYDQLRPITQQPSDDVLLIDVREPDEVALGSIPSSVNLPLSTLPAHLSSSFNPGSFVKEHMFNKPLPKQKIIFYCRSGVRSGKACEAAKEAGYGNVTNYKGSWLDWQKKEEERRGSKGGY